MSHGGVVSFKYCDTTRRVTIKTECTSESFTVPKLFFRGCALDFTSLDDRARKALPKEIVEKYAAAFEVRED